MKPVRTLPFAILAASASAVAAQPPVPSPFLPQPPAPEVVPFRQALAEVQAKKQIDEYNANGAFGKLAEIPVDAGAPKALPATPPSPTAGKASVSDMKPATKAEAPKSTTAVVAQTKIADAMKPEAKPAAKQAADAKPSTTTITTTPQKVETRVVQPKPSLWQRIWGRRRTTTTTTTSISTPAENAEAVGAVKIVTSTK